MAEDRIEKLYSLSITIKIGKGAQSFPVLYRKQQQSKKGGVGLVQSNSYFCATLIV